MLLVRLTTVRLNSELRHSKCIPRHMCHSAETQSCSFCHVPAYHIDFSPFYTRPAADSQKPSPSFPDWYSTCMCLKTMSCTSWSRSQNRLSCQNRGRRWHPLAILGLNVFLDSLNLPKLGLIILLVRLYCHHSQFSDDYDYLACVLHTIPFVIGKDVHMAQMGSRGHVYNFMPLSTSARVFL